LSFVLLAFKCFLGTLTRFNCEPSRRLQVWVTDAHCSYLLASKNSSIKQYSVSVLWKLGIYYDTHVSKIQCIKCTSICVGMHMYNRHNYL
jgi:hypothetical protein